MPYQIKCDNYILDDTRADDLSVSNPVVNLEVNTVGGCTFTIHKNHPYYDKLKLKKSVFEVSDDIGVIFRGRMTENSADFYNSKSVDLEGAMAYFNDSMIRPFSFPEEFINNAEYIAAVESGNVIEFFLKWLIDQHNSQVQEFQQFKLGDVTVADPNNYITRSNADYASTWETLKSKLFDSGIGGYLCIRYKADGNYIDYLDDFTLVNTQEIVFGENLLDLKSKVDATNTYSAVIPIGAKVGDKTAAEIALEIVNEGKWGTGEDRKRQLIAAGYDPEIIQAAVNKLMAGEELGEEYNTTGKGRLTIEGLPDGDITDDIVKSGDTIYSKKAVEAYGWICAPVKDTTWDDVTEATNLQTKAVSALCGGLSLFENTIEVTALDLHFTQEQIQTFSIYRKVNVRSAPHDHSGTYHLPKLSLNLHNPDSTKITVGATERTMVDINNSRESDAIKRIETVEKDIASNRTDVSSLKDQTVIQSTQIINDCEKIMMAALESYVETSNFEEFKSTMKAEFDVWASGISGRVEATEESVANVDGDLQKKFNTITKYFTFDIDGLTIGQIDNPNKVVIDNDEISILVNNMPVQKFKADGTALIPVLKITQSLNVVGLQMSEDDTHINCDYVGVD